MEDDDHDSTFSSSDWDIAWKAILLGAALGHLLKILPNRQQLRNIFRAVPPRIDSDLETNSNEVDMSGLDKGRHLEFDSDAATLPGFVDEVFWMDSPTNYTDVGVNTPADNPVENLSGIAVTFRYETLLKQFFTFSAGTPIAIAQFFSLKPFSLSVLFLLTLCPLYRKAFICYRKAMMAVAMLPAWSLSPQLWNIPANEEASPSVDIREDDDTKELDNIAVCVYEVKSAPAETLDAVFPVLNELTMPHIVVETTHVEAFAPESGSPFDDSGSIEYSEMDDAAFEVIPSASQSTKSFSGLVAVDSFNWDRHGSFVCSTPLPQPESLPSAENFDFGRAVYDQSDISVADSDSVNVTTIAGDPTLTFCASQELEQTRKNLDTIIEAQIKRAESSYGASLDPFDSYLQKSATVSASCFFARMTVFIASNSTPFPPRCGLVRQPRLHARTIVLSHLFRDAL